MTAPTTRRTAKITTGYVAINLGDIAPETTKIRCTARESMDITGINGASVHIEAGEVFYLYRAASLGDNMFYIVRCVLGERKCSCPSKYRPCKHEIALSAEIWGCSAAAAKSVADKAKATAKTKRADEVRGTLNGNGSFLDALFGSSPSMAKYRSDYAARVSQ